MPEMHFTVKWPDGQKARCYSPSLIVRDYLEVGRTYEVSDFVNRSRTMLEIASDRVKQKFGYYCSAAMDQLATIEEQGKVFEPSAEVLVVEFEVPPGF
jgi:uncharacterized repeat protein (TIGR04042 family)